MTRQWCLRWLRKSRQKPAPAYGRGSAVGIMVRQGPEMGKPLMTETDDAVLTCPDDVPGDPPRTYPDPPSIGESQGSPLLGKVGAHQPGPKGPGGAPTHAL